jgi:hypothetical protein
MKQLKQLKMQLKEQKKKRKDLLNKQNVLLKMHKD